MSGVFTSTNPEIYSFGTPFPVTENDIVHCVLILQGLCPGRFVLPCHWQGVLTQVELCPPIVTWAGSITKWDSEYQVLFSDNSNLSPSELGSILLSVATSRSYVIGFVSVLYVYLYFWFVCKILFLSYCIFIFYFILCTLCMILHNK